MRNELPLNHGLSEKVVESLVFKVGNQLSVSNVQYSSLDAGIGRGESALIVSPTSTGKTQIAIWALANGIDNGCNTVYLVTHRALAKQKFEDFKSLLLPALLEGDTASLVIATGDYVQDADGNSASDPLGSQLLVATYEKYLALLSASGIPTDMKSTVVVCDEIQLIGDEHRGQSVELLLTLLKNAGWRQFVGLSAVLQADDARTLSEWLGVDLVMDISREKHLNYELWTDACRVVCSTSDPEKILEDIQLPKGVDPFTLPVLASLLKEPNPPVPIIVFCMKKQDTFDLAKRFLDQYLQPSKTQLSLAFDDLPETIANQFLSGVVEHRVGIHSADLTDEERHVVEQKLIDNQLDVVFATSTLAAGVNFPLGAAIFSDWHRWDGNQRRHKPIDPSEFHNMAGRVGRMGFEHNDGRVIFFARDRVQKSSAKEYLSLGALKSIQSRIDQDDFEQLSLQLVASGICSNRQSVKDLVCSTFSGLKEQDNNTVAFSRWPDSLDSAIDDLKEKGLVLETKTQQLVCTEVGKAIAQSGLLPETGIMLLDYVAQKLDVLIACLPTSVSRGDLPKLVFLLFSACFSTPEFRSIDGKQPTRYLPWPLGSNNFFDPSCYSQDLYEPVWRADIAPINAAKLCCDWIEGHEIRALESAVPNLSAGMLREMFRNLVWVLQGISLIITAATDSRISKGSRPSSFQVDDDRLALLRRLPRTISRLSYRVVEGLPDEVLWLKSIPSGQDQYNYQLSRTEIIKLMQYGYFTPELVALGTSEADNIRLNVFEKAKPVPQVKANWLRDSVRVWKVTQRRKAAERHVKWAQRYSLDQYFNDYYSKKGDAFEDAFEALLCKLDIDFGLLDDKSKIGAPDYILRLNNSPDIIIELKSKQGDKLVDFNGAVEVLSASEIHGFGASFCVTLCHPGVDPSVPQVIANCGRLSVVESHDLGEALLRVGSGTLTQEQLWQWLTTPGQALSDDLPFRENVDFV